ncbi:MAG: SEC-C motif-containing protein [Janthinobacterium sp.]|jgi:SEC-C motif-containing protein
MKTACPCGGASYALCCGPFIDGDAVPPDAATLMRSRYSAYVLRNESYLRATWHASTRPPDAIVSDDEGLHWLGLDVKSTLRIRKPTRQPVHQLAESANPDSASVEFVARYKIAGRAHRLHEISTFVREGGRWYYVGGSFPEPGKRKPG